MPPPIAENDAAGQGPAPAEPAPVGGDQDALRSGLVAAMRRMAQAGLNRGTSGNASARCGDAILITPSGIAPDALTADMIVRLGDRAALRPSSEWRMHAGILAARPEAAAVLHCHSRYATILACCGREIPPIHYMLGKIGPGPVPVVPYETWGTAALAQAAARALEGRRGCLLAHHGQVAIGRTIAEALAVAEELEEQAAVYYGTLLIGGAPSLTEAQLVASAKQFDDYGQQS